MRENNVGLNQKIKKKKKKDNDKKEQLKE